MKVPANYVSVHPVKGHPTTKWRVAWNQGGKPRTKCFKAKEKTLAETFRAAKQTELENLGNSLAPITEPERQAIYAARREFEGLDIGATLGKAIRFYSDHLARNVRKATVAELCGLRISDAGRAGYSYRHLADLRSRLGIFTASFGGREVSSINTEELQEWLTGRASDPHTYTNLRRVVSSLFSFGLKRGYCSSNPVANTTKKKIPDTEPPVLTPEQTARLLAAATPEMLPAIALQAFAGIRTGEILRLTWDDVNDETVRVSPKKAKTSQNRHTDITENLAAFLAPYRGLTGKIAPANYALKLKRIRESAGIEDWDNSILRHGYASYSYAESDNAHKVAKNLGHKSTTLLFTHYRKLVTRENALKFLSIRPDAPENVVAITERKQA